MGFKRGQVTIFIIIGIVIIAAVVLFFTLREEVSVKGIPPSIEPVYTSFLTCLEEDVLTGIDVLESQAGYIQVPDFEPGSAYMPFSSQLDFLGNPVPYWYYVSGNNIQKEQIPSKSQMEAQLGNFISSKIDRCRFDEYYDQGFDISYGDAKTTEVLIKDNEVEVALDMNLVMSKGEDSATIGKHKVIVNSKLGVLYDNAVKIYEKEQEELFLENYGVDNLRAYAPVDGVELTCGPKIWNADEVFDELEVAIEANTLALKSKGASDDYFVVDLPVSEGIEARFFNSREWPHSFEVEPNEGPLLVSTPVGNQPGLGALGFCYAPYHFVYNIRYPVLVQVSSGSDVDAVQEIFQFPVAIVLQGNQPRKALDASAVEIPSPEVCRYKNTLVDVNTYDVNLNPVDAEISYECFSEICSIGKTSSGFLSEEFPQCVNGFVVAKAEGFVTKKELFSTIEEGSVGIIMDRIYELDVDFRLNGRSSEESAIISFISDDFSTTLVYPEQKKIKLSEGQYEIQVFVYKDSSLKISKTVKEQCLEVPRTGLGGLVGLTKQECFEIEIPGQDVSSALSGGGKQNYYVTDSELLTSSSIEINAESLPVPNSLDQLQINYILFEEKGLDIVFK